MKCFQDRDRTVLGDRRFLVPEDVTERVFLAFHQIDHRARDCLLAFESGDLRLLAKHRIALVDLRHLRSLHSFVSALVIENEKALIADHLVFVEELFCAGKIPFRIDIFDVNFSFGGVLVFGEQILHVGPDRIVRAEENCHAHLAFYGIEETLRFIGERVSLVARKIPALVMLEAEVIHHRREEENQPDLDKHVQSDRNAMDFFRFGLWFGLVRHRIQSSRSGAFQSAEMRRFGDRRSLVASRGVITISICVIGMPGK